MTRNGPANFIQPAQQQGVVYGLGTAMVQMGDAIAAEPVKRSIQHLNNGNDGSKIQIAFSKQNYLSESTNPYTLLDNSIIFKVYCTSKNNSFHSRASFSTSSIPHPDCHPSQLRMFPLKSECSSFGFNEFPSEALAVYAIMKCNHSAIDLKGTKFPFIMKLCFSSAKPMNGAWSNENIKNP
ncbi:uncharacterized protein LOC135709558 [Ochlerotatus camptorhynchus]|uniref:uncharacterized protein LOC135709558 n=1 Tax=Ochlerotatus camptorhynchus TaxID=644619 RepID=UPI0031D3D934